jgi:BMFP domain-containing protein YqiC
MKSNKIDELIQQVINALPEDVQQMKQGFEKNLRSAMNATFAKMDLVNREEFDVQAALLARTRALLEEMEEKINQLEEKIAQKNQKAEK